MNKKGQVLALFVILLPILILLVGLIIDTGLAYMEKRKIENLLYDTISYGLDHIEENDIKMKLKYLITENLNIESDITIENNIITIQIEAKIKTFFHGLNPYNHIKISYQGNTQNGKKNIRRTG